MTRVDNNEEEILPWIRDLYPELDEAGLKEATQNFKEYADIVIRILSRQLREVMEKEHRNLDE
ncbi:MAG: hypothetical protein KGH79_05005 [Patescibacteria group bacterium]|nr:hypothetical protein [Patescibacteria group bacterium]